MPQSLAKPGHGKRVLIVEDEMLVAMLIEDILTEHGFTVAATANSMDQALTFLNRDRCDIAVLDLNLDGTRTFALADEMLNRAIPFVFSTGYGTDGIDAGYAHIRVVQKPFQDEALVAAVLESLQDQQPSARAG
jgi:CheY-like chemotaxis protein